MGDEIPADQQVAILTDTIRDELAWLRQHRRGLHPSDPLRHETNERITFLSTVLGDDGPPAEQHRATLEVVRR